MVKKEDDSGNPITLIASTIRIQFPRRHAEQSIAMSTGLISRRTQPRPSIDTELVYREPELNLPNCEPELACQ
jgi:hypothetical protein